MDRKSVSAAAMVRARTLRLVQGLSQAEADSRPAADRWSVGEVLDHLLRVDALVLRETQAAFEAHRVGWPVVYRSLVDLDSSLPLLLQPAIRLMELPVSAATVFLPPVLRRAFTANRAVPARAPKLLEPRRGRPLAELDQELAATMPALERVEKRYPGSNAQRILYFNPIVGLGPLSGLYAFLSSHEERHQGQLADLLSVLRPT